MNNKITLTLPPSEQWLTMINENVRHYAKLHKFIKHPEDDLTQSLLEACEAFLLMAHKVGISDDYEVSFDFHNDAIVLGLVYNGKIPLNPHETEDYEVPESEADLDKINLDVLWLHLIRRRMDRVYFLVQGSKHALQMIKYRREIGKERRQWVMGLSPSLREDLRIEYFKSDNEVLPMGCIIQDPESEIILKLGPSEAFMIQNMNGENTCYDIYMEHINKLDMISPQRISLLYEKLEAARLLADPDREKTQSRFRKIILKLINPSVSIPYPDEAITSAYRLTRFLFNPIGFILLLLVGLSGIYPLLNHYDQFMNTIANLENFFLSYPEAIFILYFLILVVAFIHEFGHGLMCKHYGGQVNRLGIMFYLGTFIFFCDTSAAWNFPRRSQRFLVSLAGPLTTFAVLGLGLWAAGAYVHSGTIWESIWVCISLVCIVILILNFNPFIRMDAYYMLMDLTNIPNLRSRSLEFIKKKLIGRFFSKQQQEEEITPQVKSLFWLYGIIGALITLIFAILPFINITRILVRESSRHGKVLLGFALLTLIIFRLGYQGYQKFRAIRHRTYKLK
jgi:putative peptide zinc metalloprotease protein